MLGCEGDKCTVRHACARFMRRASAQLVSRVLCRAGRYEWLVPA